MMLIADRNGMVAASNMWRNPYVTDGLVAMYDGEWNAGPGVHDSNATTWVNLARYLGPTEYPDATVVESKRNRYVWESNACRFLPYNAYDYVWTVLPSSQGINVVALKGTAKTLEICDQGISRSSNTGSNWIQSWQGPGITYGDASSNNSIQLILERSIETSNYIRSQYKCTAVYDFTKKRSVMLRRVIGTPSTARIRFNNEQNEYGITGSPIWNSTTSTPLCQKLIGYIYNNSSLRTHCIRVYNRWLSDDEHAHNYAIDAVRFNFMGGGGVSECVITFITHIIAAACKQQPSCSSQEWRAAA